MKQVTKKNKSSTHHKKEGKGKLKRNHPKFGTSKLEQDFAELFLDELGVEYICQFEAKDIGRFYDYMVFTKQSHSPILLEIDGGYW